MRSTADAAAVERLVLVSSGGEANPALESRAQLIASEMHPAPAVVTPQQDADLMALTKPSDLVLVDRIKPPPFVLPYLGRDARRLLRKGAAPVLVVAGAARRPYRHVAVATDLQTDIAAALAVIKAIAPNASLTLLHAYHALFDGKLQWAGVSASDVAQYRGEAQREAAKSMVALLDRHRALRPARTLLRYDRPVPGVLRAAEALEADLIVVVRKGQPWWAEVLGASVSLDLAQRADRDVLIVR